MSDEEDLELLALQRQLDDAFRTTRPRPGFEDELWRRMQSRRPLWLRLGDGLAGLVAGIREAPAVPSAAVAIVLVVLLGAGIYTLNGLHSGGSAASLQGGGAVINPAAAPASGQFGAVPRPAYGAPVAGPTIPNATSLAEYSGPATLVWAGDLQVSVAALPVYRYTEPTLADANRFAASLGASPSLDVALGGIGVYAGRDFTLIVLSSVQQPPREPHYNVSDVKSTAASTADSVTVATGYLAAHDLLPTWPYKTEVQTLAGTTVRVSFLRSFNVQGLGQASLVDSSGNPYGTEVDFAPGIPGAFERGPMPLTLEPASYPIISADQAIRSLGASSAQSGAAVPVVRITTAQVVYTVVWGGDVGYYEPAYLFSGTFSNRGVTSVKRVLIPAVVPSLLTP